MWYAICWAKQVGPTPEGQHQVPSPHPSGPRKQHGHKPASNDASNRNPWVVQPLAEEMNESPHPVNKHVSLYIHIYIYIYLHTCICNYIYIHHVLLSLSFRIHGFAEIQTTRLGPHALPAPRLRHGLGRGPGAAPRRAEPAPLRRAAAGGGGAAGRGGVKRGAEARARGKRIWFV